MKKQLPEKQYTISDFQFSIYPKTITFRSSSQGRYSLYLEKGAQVIGKYQQIATSQNKIFTFSVIQRKKFRIFNDKSVSYQWSIYKISDENQSQEFLQSSIFSVQKTYSTYIGYFNQAQLQLRKNLKSKQNSKIEQVWKGLKKMVEHESYVQSCLFKSSMILLEFECEIKCEFDMLLQTYQLKKIEMSKFKQEQLKRKASRSSLNDSRIKNSEISFDSKKQEKPALQCKNGQNQHSKQKDKLNYSPIKQIDQNIRQSEIQIFDPQGTKIDLQNSSNQNANRLSKSSEDYTDYQKKRNSMLSDIIQQSYEGSSNINASKSNGQQKLKSIDAINQENNESPFSPVVRTQTFQSQKFDQIINFKRTATLRHKTSKDYDLQQNKQNQHQQTSEQYQYYSNSKHSHTQDQLQQSVQNINCQKMKTRKKLIVIFAIIIIFTILIGTIYWKQNGKKIKSIKSNRKIKEKQSIKSKVSKSKTQRK